MALTLSRKESKINKLPKLYRVVEIEFWTIRGALGDNLGMTEVDVRASRKARRVLCGEGWKWQIASADKISEWDYYVLADQECLDSDLDYDDVEIKGFNQ